jgi:hypothetical protein
VIGIDQPQVGLVHEGSGAEGMVGALGAQAIRGKLAELVIDDGH